MLLRAFDGCRCSFKINQIRKNTLPQQPQRMFGRIVCNIDVVSAHTNVFDSIPIVGESPRSSKIQCSCFGNLVLLDHCIHSYGTESACVNMGAGVGTGVTCACGMWVWVLRREQAHTLETMWVTNKDGGFVVDPGTESTINRACIR